MLRKTVRAVLVLLFAAAALPAEVEAQRRAVVRRSAPPRVVVAARPYYRVYYSPFYSPWYGWYGPAWYGAGWYGGPGWYPYGWYGQYYPARYRYDYSGSARLDVKPREAEVFIDGYLVGRVDDFDGWLQRLHVAPGEHELQIFKPGYRTFRERVLFRPGATIRISHDLEPLAPGQPDEARPAPSPGSSARRPAEYPPGRPDYPPSRRPDAPRSREADPARSGTLAIRVQPTDAEVLIDGERWDGPEGSDRLVVQLTEGEHRVEIRRDGYRPFSTSVRIRRGETSPLNVSLTRED